MPELVNIKGNVFLHADGQYRAEVEFNDERVIEFGPFKTKAEAFALMKKAVDSYIDKLGAKRVAEQTWNPSTH